MNPLIELVIRARERGEDQDPRIARACVQIERMMQAARERRARKDAKRGVDCAVCGRTNRFGLLCRLCHAQAPARVQTAFATAVGLDGMRAAVATVAKYSRAPMAREEPA